MFRFLLHYSCANTSCNTAIYIPLRRKEARIIRSSASKREKAGANGKEYLEAFCYFASQYKPSDRKISGTSNDPINVLSATPNSRVMMDPTSVVAKERGTTCQVHTQRRLLIICLDDLYLPLDVLGEIAIHLVIQGLLETCASLNVTSHAVHEETNRTLYGIVVPWHKSSTEHDSGTKGNGYKERVKDQFDEIFVCERAHLIE